MAEGLRVVNTNQLQEIREHYTPGSEHKGKHATEDVIILLRILDAKTKECEAVGAALDVALAALGF